MEVVEYLKGMALNWILTADMPWRHCVSFMQHELTLSRSADIYMGEIP